MSEEEFIRKYARQAVIFEVGGFRPSGDLLESWIGKVLVAAEGESWQISNL